jgi:hypothetical protein
MAAMTPSEIAAFVKEQRELCDAATPGPWKLDEHFQCYIWGPKMQMVADDGLEFDQAKAITRMRGVGANLPLKQNGDFIASARTSLPKAIRIIEDQQAKILELEARSAQYRKWASLGGAPSGLVCTADPNDNHEIYGAGFTMTDGSHRCEVHELHWHRGRIAELEREKAERDAEDAEIDALMEVVETIAPEAIAKDLERMREDTDAG